MFNSKFFKQMKRLSYFLCAALVAFGAASCEKTPEVVDFPVVGPLTFEGTYDSYAHGAHGWVEGDEIGLFVTSDGVIQANLHYAPSEYATIKDSEVGPELQGDVKKTAFKAVGSEIAGFKKGEHQVYAYVRYDASSTDYKAVKLPDLSVQEYYSAFGANPKYTFAYAKLAEPLTEYTAETISLGEFVCPFSSLTISSLTFDEEKFKAGDVVSKVVVSAETGISVSNATINLETGEISEKGKSIEIKLPEGGFQIKNSDWGLDLETLFVVVCNDVATSKDTEYTITLTINGKEYTAKGKPSMKYMDNAMFMGATVE